MSMAYFIAVLLGRFPPSLRCRAAGPHFDTAVKKDLSPAALEEKAPDRVVLSQADRAVEGYRGLAAAAQRLQEMAADSPIRLVAADRPGLDLVEEREARRGPLHLGDRRGPADPGADRGGELHQTLVEPGDRAPVGPPGARSLGVDRLNRGLDLEPAATRRRRRRRELALRFLDHRRDPETRLLLGERHELDAKDFPQLPLGTDALQGATLAIAAGTLREMIDRTSAPRRAGRRASQ